MPTQKINNMKNWQENVANGIDKFIEWANKEYG